MAPVTVRWNSPFSEFPISMTLEVSVAVCVSVCMWSPLSFVSSPDSLRV